MNTVSPKTEFTFPGNSFSANRFVFSITEEFISLNDQSLQIQEVTSIRYGISVSQLYKFYPAITFLIDLKDGMGQEINIRMTSIFNMRRKLFNALFADMATIIWDKLAVKLINDKLTLLESNHSFFVGKCEIKPEGILIDGKNLIAWHECFVQRNADQLVISSKTNHRIYTCLPYAEHWDVFILAEIAEHILNPTHLKQ